MAFGWSGHNEFNYVGNYPANLEFQNIAKNFNSKTDPLAVLLKVGVRIADILKHEYLEKNGRENLEDLFQKIDSNNDDRETLIKILCNYWLE